MLPESNEYFDNVKNALEDYKNGNLMAINDIHFSFDKIKDIIKRQTVYTLEIVDEKIIHDRWLVFIEKVESVIQRLYTMPHTEDTADALNRIVDEMKQIVIDTESSFDGIRFKELMQQLEKLLPDSLKPNDEENIIFNTGDKKKEYGNSEQEKKYDKIEKFINNGDDSDDDKEYKDADKTSEDHNKINVEIEAPESLSQVKENMIIQTEDSQTDNDLQKTYDDAYFSGIVEDQKMLVQFVDEVKEHLDNAQLTLVDLEYDSTNQENINKVFRSFHTIKSSSAFLGVKNIEDVAHEMEELLVIIRDGKLFISSELIDVIFFGIGVLRDLINIIDAYKNSIKEMVNFFKKISIFSYIALIKKILKQYQGRKIGEILREQGKIDQKTVAFILEKQKETNKKFGEILIDQNIVTHQDISSAVTKQASHLKKSSYVKVSNDRLNMLIDIVGELVVNQSMMRQVMKEVDLSSDISERSISQLENITTTIKNLVLSMGMVPISDIFNKLRVVVRNASTELGKVVAVNMEGETTELDRNVMESIYDPLVHIVRNAVDHGIEMPQERESAGKNKIGTITVKAEHHGSGIEITIMDDGKGIDIDKIFSKACFFGLTKEEQKSVLTKKDIYSFMFLPGFSTAEKVTEISGRGVGLDVVRKNIDQIHGKIEVSSEQGKYTKFVIRLPLTLAIIDGFVAIVDEKKYIFPFTLIDEIVVPDEKQLKKMDNGQIMIYNREMHVPVIFASEIFSNSESGKKDKIDLLIIISFEEKKFAVAVDKIIGKQEIVIKGLSEALGKLKYFSGGTIFGDGSIGFVIDTEEFIEVAKNRNHISLVPKKDEKIIEEQTSS